VQPQRKTTGAGLESPGVTAGAYVGPQPLEQFTEIQLVPIRRERYRKGLRRQLVKVWGDRQVQIEIIGYYGETTQASLGKAGLMVHSWGGTSREKDNWCLSSETAGTGLWTAGIPRVKQWFLISFCLMVNRQTAMVIFSDCTKEHSRLAVRIFFPVWV
jgi:hypothetical protein